MNTSVWALIIWFNVSVQPQLLSVAPVADGRTCGEYQFRLAQTMPADYYKVECRNLAFQPLEFNRGK